MNKTTAWFKSGSPWIWMTGGALSISLVMVVGLLLLITVRGLSHFWPAAIIEADVSDPAKEQAVVLGQVTNKQLLTRAEMLSAGYEVPDGVELDTRHLIKIGNRDQYGRDFQWFLESHLSEWRYPEDAVMVERLEWGNFYGYLDAVKVDGEVVAKGADAWESLQDRLAKSTSKRETLRDLERDEIGRINARLEKARLAERGLAMDADNLSESEYAKRAQEIADNRAAAEADYQGIQAERNRLRSELNRTDAVFRMAGGEEVTIRIADIVKASRNNAMSIPQKLGFYIVGFWDFVSGYPREANTEGGIFPAIFGTVAMVLLMSIVVTPFGIIAAIYLREYAKDGPILRMVRISVYNLAGVPSIVFGVFGVGFFVYALGGNIDALFYPEKLPQPTFGTPGLLWASLTLALLTLPVVIVSTEEGLTRIPRSVREGSLALGATKAETLWKIIVPMAAPAMMTGLILAVARAAGEVAPLMLVGVVKLAPTLPIDGSFPFVHLDRKIMHLGFHIYDVGFQSPNVEAGRPLVYATAAILVLIIMSLNLTAISIRNRLRERYRSESD